MDTPGIQELEEDESLERIHKGALRGAQLWRTKVAGNIVRCLKRRTGDGAGSAQIIIERYRTWLVKTAAVNPSATDMWVAWVAELLAPGVQKEARREDPSPLALEFGASIALDTKEANGGARWVLRLPNRKVLPFATKAMALDAWRSSWRRFFAAKQTLSPIQELGTT